MTPLRDDFAVLAAKLTSNKRFDLYNKNYLFRIKWMFPLVLIFVLMSFLVLFFFGSFSQFQLVFFGLMAIAVLALVHLISRRARVASLKGDAIILKGISDKSSVVTSIKSVNRASSFHLFGLQITRLYYTLDQKKYNSLIFGAPSGMKTSLDQLIRFAKKEKNKRQIISRVL